MTADGDCAKYDNSRYAFLEETPYFSIVEVMELVNPMDALVTKDLRLDSLVLHKQSVFSLPQLAAFPRIDKCIMTITC